jgi:hypothetical protein
VIWAGWRPHRSQAIAPLGATIAGGITPSHCSSYGHGAGA